MSRSGAKPGNRKEALEQLAHAGRSMSDAIVLFHARAAESFAMGSSDWKALGLIAQHGPISHRELVRHLGLKPASVTNILDRLQSADWIVRTRSSEDGRSVVITANQEKLGAFRQQVFGPLMKRLDEVYAQYGDADLVLIADAFSKIAEAQRMAADEISGPATDTI